MDFVFRSDARTFQLDRMLWFTAQVPLVYDYLLTLGDEAQYVWPCPRSWGVSLFYINRYIAFIELAVSCASKFLPMTITGCAYTSITTFWIMIFGNLISTLIVVMRTYALWGRRRVIKYTLALLVMCTYAAVVALLSYQSSFIFTPTNIALMKIFSARIICPMPTVGTIVSLHYVGLLSLVCLGELVIVALTLYKAKDHLRESSSSSWIRQLYQNGILHCVSIFGLSVVCMLMSVFGPPMLEFSLVPHQRVFHSIFCNHMLFLIFKQRPELLVRTSQRVSTRLVFTSLTTANCETADEGRQMDSWESGWSR